MGIKRLAIWILLLSVLLGQIILPAAASDTDDILRQMLEYYLHYQDDAETDILRLLRELEAIDPEQAEDWNTIFNLWRSCEDLPVNPGVLPDGLPEDDSLCIVVMGFALNYNGSMSKELQGRLNVALASAQKYPKAYILCTGGGTAGGNHAVTEAGQMAAWLQEQGIDTSRIIVENKSYSTELNARFGLGILRESYPQVSKLALVSSDYHIRRCHLLFCSEIIFTGTENQYQVVSNAAYEAGYIGESGYWSEVESLSNLLNLHMRYSFVPKLSELSEITVSGEQTYFVGDAPDLTVTAFYDSGFFRDVTQKAELRGFDSSIPGEIQIEIIYTEQDQPQSTVFPVTILTLPTEATISPETEPLEIETTEPSQTPDAIPDTSIDKPSNISQSVIWIGCSIVAAVLVIFILPKKKRGKYQK